MGLPHGDEPTCVSPALRKLKINLNDRNWSSKEARANGLRRLSVIQLGTKDTLDDEEFSRRLAEMTIKTQVPIALRAAASIHPDSNHKATMLSAADRCEKEGTEAAAEDLSPEALAAVAGDDEAPAPAAPRYTTDDLAGLAAQRAELTTTKAKALKDLMDGVIEPEEYSRIEGEVSDKLDALTVQRTLHEANVQTEAQQQASVLDTIMRAAKKAGEVDYATDAKAAKQFDTAMKMLGDDGEKRSYAELAADAHKMVLAARGVAKVESITTLTPAKARENGKGPMTLRNVPAAAVAQCRALREIVWASAEKQVYDEGCLSVPGMRGLVPCEAAPAAAGSMGLCGVAHHRHTPTTEYNSPKTAAD